MQLTLRCILQNLQFPVEELEKFCKAKYSSRVFGLSYPLLRRKREWTKDYLCYANYLKCHGKYYCLCNAWTESLRPKLEVWVRLQLGLTQVKKKELNWERSLLYARQKDFNYPVQKRIRLSKKSHSRQVTQDNSWIYDCGYAWFDTEQTLHKEIIIPKTEFKKISDEQKLCVFIVTVEDAVYSFSVESKTLENKLKYSGLFKDNLSTPSNSEWRLFLDVTTNGLYSSNDNSELITLCNTEKDISFLV